MTGVGQKYEQPSNPEVRLDGTSPLEVNAQTLVEWVINRPFESQRSQTPS
jgi:adenylylsulfate kinase-like enzyme